MDNRHKVKTAATQISFLMEHQTILPDLITLVERLYCQGEQQLNRDSPEYLLGAYEALTSLLNALKTKGD